MTSQKLSKSQIDHLAKLANLKLAQSEEAKFRLQLSEILVNINQLNQLNTKSVEPTSQVTGLENVFREDVPEPSLSVEEVLSGAKDKINEHFRIKSVFEEK